MILWVASSRAAAEKARESGFLNRTPSGQGDIGLPVLWQPVYMRGISTTPINP
jgi:hypothetical protein